jgi:RNA polymerase sigma-70 factor (ECF subfamily)
MNQPTQMTDIRRDLVALLPRLRRFALTLTGVPADANDLAREVCGRAIMKSHHWKGEGRIEHWLFSMMRSTWNDETRKRRRSGHDTTAGRDAATPAEASAGNFFLSMSPELSSAFLLGDVERFSYAECAAILGISIETFAARLSSARLRLAAIGLEVAERRA